MKKLKIGVFGAGRGLALARALAGHPDACLSAVCDRYTPLLDQVRQLADETHSEVTCYDNFDDFFQHDMNAVILANYATEHAPYAVRFLRSGRHVLSEVLPCETMAQAVELVEAAEESGMVYAYAENYCYMDNTFEMWRRTVNGDIGEVLYGEGSYIHDCSSIWPSITYGDPAHWRNHLHANFYCTHSLGPLMTISGLRPIQVTGFELPPNPDFYRLGHVGGHPAGMELVTMENGAVFKSIHGPLKAHCLDYAVYGAKGSICSERGDGSRVSVYRENGKACQGENESYRAEKFISPELVNNSEVTGHNGSDFYSTHLFIEKILGREDGKRYSIDVYQAVDMGICGILAYRSVLEGNRPIHVPNLRNRAERDAYRSDNACTNPSVAGDRLLPASSHGERKLSNEDFTYIQEVWKSGKVFEAFPN